MKKMFVVLEFGKLDEMIKNKHAQGRRRLGTYPFNMNQEVGYIAFEGKKKYSSIWLGC